jgi:hypothetical protein
LDEDTYTATCAWWIEDFIDNTEEITLIYQDIYRWGGSTVFINNFKPASFVHSRYLEYFYPLSAFCSEVNDELLIYSYEVVSFFKAFTQEGDTPEDQVALKKKKAMLLMKSVSKHIGTILKNLVELDDCFVNWDGRCVGAKIGQAAHGFIDD